MAKLECELVGDFDRIRRQIEEGVMGRSASATLEDSCTLTVGGARCVMNVYERYSVAGSNRVSMSVLLTECDGGARLTAITAGGSQAMMFKINTFGEDAFLETLKDTVAGMHKK